MNIEIWGFQASFYLALPVRPFGYLLLSVELALILYLFLRSRRGRSRSPSKGQTPYSIAVLVFLLLLAPLAAQTFLVQLPGPATSGLPGVPIEPEGAFFALFGALPWILAAAYFGSGPAIAVGLAGGLARAGWGTNSIITPASFALQAAVAAALLRSRYADRLSRALRQPILAGLIAGFVYALAQIGESFAYTGGELYTAVRFTLLTATSVIVAASAEATLGGLFGQLSRLSVSSRRPIVDKTSVPGYQSSLSGRLLFSMSVVGFVAISAVAYGVWDQTRHSVRAITANQMSQIATQAGGQIPVFLESGRLAARRSANSFSPGEAQENEFEQFEKFAFFRDWAIYDASGSVTDGLAATTPAQPLAFDAALLTALAGIPEELIIEDSEDTSSLALVFFFPIISPEGGEVEGAFAGWAPLSSNPLISPTQTLFDSIDPIEAYLLDGQGRVLLSSSGAGDAGFLEVDGARSAGLQQRISGEGVQYLEYLEVIEGAPWQVLVHINESEVDQVAFQLSVRLLGVLLLIGAVALLFVITSSRRLTRPLEDIAESAERIADGDLDHPIRAAQRDEVGRLADSFEYMRSRLKARLTEMDVLLEFSSILVSTMDMHQSMPRVLRLLRKSTGAQFTRLILADDTMDQKGEVFSSGTVSGDLDDLDAEILSLARVRQAFHLENPSRAAAVLPLEGIDPALKALSAVSINNGETFEGVLWLAHKNTHKVSPEERRLLSILSGQLGVAIANARLYRSVEEERRRLAGVLEATPDAIIVLDDRDRIALANPASEFLLEGTLQESVKKPLVNQLLFSEVTEMLNIKDGKVEVGEVEHENGSVYFVTVSALPAGEGESAGKVVVLRDITHYKELDELKSDFVATVSHDLRSPLTLTRGYTTMLSMVGELSEQQNEFVQKILNSIDQMTTLVDDLLDLGRIEAGLALDLTEIATAELIQEAVSAVRPQAVHKQISIEIDLPAALPNIHADRPLLRQAVGNLLDNAIKYTPEGGKVRIGARADGFDVVMEVSDTGVGVSPTDQPRLFEKFFRAHTRDTRQKRGSGLGLSIVKSIVEQHNGSVKAESQLGQGSTFTIRIPTVQEKLPQNA